MVERDVYVCYTTIDRLARLGTEPFVNEVLSPAIAELLKPTEVFIAYRIREDLPIFALTMFVDGRQDPHLGNHTSIFGLAVPYGQRELLHYLGRNVDVEGHPLKCHIVFTTEDLAELVSRDILNLERHAVEVR